MAKVIVSNHGTRRRLATARSKALKYVRSDFAGQNNINKKGYQVASVAKALDLLEAICEEASNDLTRGDEVGVTQLSKRVGMQKTAVFRLLATFESRGYVEHLEHYGFYRIGVSAFELGRKLLLRMTTLSQARPVMEDLCRRCNEAVYLAIRRGSEFLFIDLVEGAQQVKIAALVGKRFPLNEAAPGQVFLAYAKEADTQVSAVTSEFILCKGYHHEQGGLGEMVSCLAAPLFDSFGAIAGALCVIGPSFRMPESQIEGKFWPLLKDASDAVSSKLGYLKPYAGIVRL